MPTTYSSTRGGVDDRSLPFVQAIMRGLALDAGREHRNDVLMTEFGRDLSLSEEPCGRLRIGCDPRWEDLERDVPIERVLPRFVHHPHPPASDLAAQGVVAEGAEIAVCCS